MHLITKYVRTATTNVFKKMIKVHLWSDLTAPEQEIPEIPIDGIAGSVSFTGAMNGTNYLLISEPYAKELTLAMFGEKRCARMDYSRDFCGEMTNMITGYLKSRLGDRGLACKLTPPTVITGRELTLHAKEPSMGFYNAFDVDGRAERIHVFTFVQIELQTWQSGMLDLISGEGADEEEVETA